MPWLKHDSVRLYHEFDGGPAAGKSVLVLPNSPDINLGMWEPQFGALHQRFHLPCYGQCGYDQPSIPDASFSVAQPGGNVFALLGCYSIELVLFCSLSMGGLTGL